MNDIVDRLLSRHNDTRPRQIGHGDLCNEDGPEAAKLIVRLLAERKWYPFALAPKGAPEILVYDDKSGIYDVVFWNGSEWEPVSGGEAYARWTHYQYLMPPGEREMREIAALNALIAWRTYTAMKLARACAKRGASLHDEWVLATARSDIERWRHEREEMEAAADDA